MNKINTLLLVISLELIVLIFLNKEIIKFLQSNIFYDLSLTVVGGFLGAVVALLFEKYKEPKLDIVAEESANQDWIYRDEVDVVLRGRWKFYRARVINKSLPILLKPVFTRQVAQQLSAKISYKQINKSYKGRWSSSIELAYVNPLEIHRLANFPDPETIPPGENALLDIFVKSEKDKEAYGWNNEAYLISNSWRTEKYKLNPGKYNIEISITGVNSQIKKHFVGYIGKSIETTSLK